MFGSMFKFFLYGIVWLFIFSIPIEGGSKKLFDVGYRYIVNSEPVKKITPYITSIFSKKHLTSLEE